MKLLIENIQKITRLQQLAGILSEDINVVNRILDKISAQGINSLEPEEREYLERYSRGEKNILTPVSNTTAVYVGEPYRELYKIENFPALSNTEDIDFECSDTEDPTTCENYPEMVEMLKNKNFKSILDKIHNNETFRHYKPLYFHGINFDGDFSSPVDIAYAQVSGDGFLYIVDSLDKFSDDYQTEEGWEVEDWKKL